MPFITIKHFYVSIYVKYKSGLDNKEGHLPQGHCERVLGKLEKLHNLHLFYYVMYMHFMPCMNVSARLNFCLKII